MSLSIHFQYSYYGCFRLKRRFKVIFNSNNYFIIYLQTKICKFFVNPKNPLCELFFKMQYLTILRCCAYPWVVSIHIHMYQIFTYVCECVIDLVTNLVTYTHTNIDFYLTKAIIVFTLNILYDNCTISAILSYILLCI